MQRAKARKLPLLERWSRATSELDVPAPPNERREIIISAMAHTMGRVTSQRAERRRIRRRVVGGCTLGAAAAAIAVLAVGHWRAHAVPVAVVAHLHSSFGTTHAVSPFGEEAVDSLANGADVPLTFGAKVSTEEKSSAQLSLTSGAKISLGPEARMILPGAGALSAGREELRLDVGLVRIDVPKLPEGHVLAVRTPDALVTVHGTSFIVEVTRPSSPVGSVTKVIVNEGIVDVLSSGRDVLLPAGADWTSASGSPFDSSSTDNVKEVSSAAPALKPIGSRLRPPASPASAASTASAVSPEAPAASGLAEQNAFFASAIAARERGDQAEAARILEELITRYPASPLAQNAYVERFRLLARAGDRAGAARDARRYLVLFPNGFARDDARRLVLEVGRVDGTSSE